jgi:uncharacterized protein
MPHFSSSFPSPFYLPGGQLQTIWPALCRQVAPLRQPISALLPTPDGDELSYDYYDVPNARAIVILCHGLEGNNRRQYMLGMANALIEQSYAVFSWNYRSCGGRMNHQLRFYHSGATDDLAVVIAHLVSKSSLPIYLVGFSLGGNLVLRWLGEQATAVPEQFKAAAAISVPMDLAAGSDFLARPAAMWYTRHFLKRLKRKIQQKASMFPGHINTAPLQTLKSLRDFDEHYTAPLHGFADANDYYARASSLFVLEEIRRPVLLIQAANDPFLPPSCYPTPSNRLIHSCFSLQGGHVGFMQSGSSISFPEQQVPEFFNQLCITC